MHSDPARKKLSRSMASPPVPFALASSGAQVDEISYFQCALKKRRTPDQFEPAAAGECGVCGRLKDKLMQESKKIRPHRKWAAAAGPVHIACSSAFRRLPCRLKAELQAMGMLKC